jgi:hypothetical protein
MAGRRAVTVLGAVTAAGVAAVPASAQDLPPCQTSQGAVFADAPRKVAEGRSAAVRMLTSTADAQRATFTVTARDPAKPIRYPVSVPYSSLPQSGIDEARHRLRTAKGDGDIVMGLTWETTEGSTRCRARVVWLVRVYRGDSPRISIEHEGTRELLFFAENQECHHTALVSVAVEFRGPGGRVRLKMSDICGRSGRRTGSNPHFRLRTFTGGMRFTAAGRTRAAGTYRATFTIRVKGRLVERGSVRIRRVGPRTRIFIARRPVRR